MTPPIEALALDLWNTVTGCAYPTNPMRRLLEAVAAAGGGDAVAIVSECTMLRPLPGIGAGLRAIEARMGTPLMRGEERARFIELWQRACTRNLVFRDVEPVLRNLRRRFRLGVISNTQSFDMEFWERSEVRKLLGVEILSCTEGALKPTPRLYERFAAAIGVDPERILMVGDNSRDDIEGARRAGFQALRIARALPYLSHREPAGEEVPVTDFEDLERRLSGASAAVSNRAVGREAPGRSAAGRRRARAARRRRR